jgi:hypothetical protein
MNFLKAVEIAEKNKNLVGRKYRVGVILDNLREYAF